MWVFNNNPRVSKGCEVLKVGCLKHPYRGVPGVWVLDIKICGGHYLEERACRCALYRKVMWILILAVKEMQQITSPELPSIVYKKI